MKGISGPGNPTSIMKLSNGEYKHMGLKVENFAPLILLPEFKVQYIESLMPSKKTMQRDRYLEYMEFVRDHCSLLTDFLTSGSTNSSFGDIVDVKELFQIYVDDYFNFIS